MTKHLSGLPHHCSIFIDANIFLYFLLKDEKYFFACERFLSHVETGETIGFTDTLAMSETLFLYLKIHLIAQHNLSPKEFLTFAKSHPQKVSEIDLKPCLDLFATETLRIITPPTNIILEYLPRIHRYGLLPNDSYHLLTMDYLNIDHIATADKDFMNISHLNVWAP